MMDDNGGEAGAGEVESVRQGSRCIKVEAYSDEGGREAQRAESLKERVSFNGLAYPLQFCDP